MNKLSLPLAGMLLLLPFPAQAQVHVQLNIGLPVAPPLVQVSPGIQVVEGFPEEVFFNAGWYWCRRPDGWYRARSPQARFGWVDGGRVPGALVRMPVGQYRNWHHDMRPGERRPGGGRPGGGRPEGRRERRPGQP
jgi:hypothetical protein